MDRLLLVDGSNLLFQMFYGMPARIVGPDGRPIQGTLGFLGALLKIIRRVKPTHVAVLFDGECASGRQALDEDYKANRTDFSQLPEEETPFSQLPDIYRGLDDLGIRHRETWDCETDDWIAGYVAAAEERFEIVIASQDSDYYQLISHRVCVLRYRGERTVLCDPDWIREKLGIEPEQYADFKALTGDAADNIRGAEKIGPKTAALLLRQFGSLENLLASPEAVSRPSVRESVIRNTQRLRKNYALIRLSGGATLPFSLEDLRWQDPGCSTTEIMKAIGLR